MNVVRLLALATVVAAAPAIAQVTVSDAWVRGTVAGQRVTGAFMRLASADDVALVAASSPIAAKTEIHEMTMDGGVMRMRAVDRVRVPKGGSVALEPGGYHLMLTGLERPVAAGDAIPLSLTFQHADGRRSQVDVVATARPLAAKHDGMKH